jgi:hypothetical protein
VVTVNIFSGATAAVMNAEEATMAKTEKTSAYPGLGDQAFSGTLSVGSGVPSGDTLAARRGSVEVMVVSTASLSDEKSLEEQLFAKIG